MRKQNSPQVFRITGARQGLAEDVRGRQRRYVISMGIRTLSIILAVPMWDVQREFAIVCLALGILLPYGAVVIANAGRENVPSLPNTAYAAPAPAPPSRPELVGVIIPPDAPTTPSTDGSSGTAASGTSTAGTASEQS
ncbi:DUF3099 domain-containing protein [Streptomyces sp. NA04227]|uniref:DUF3099 domain-containing protein n=1 Tax=Streptomyces sp. NA04227 TaxID=2742136 RepID=UPI001591A0FB|nr:DUF3099 domain-containing protein [Streptomyces sp. NA04227]QKW05763.1 DUF3099 domain-containing protein [Streptomyces sp. NA04227]